MCVSCGYLVGVNDDRCYNCGRRNPGLWGFATAVRRLGNDLGFVQFVTAVCLIMYLLSLLMTGGAALEMSGSIFNLLSPNGDALFLFGASGAIPVTSAVIWPELSPPTVTVPTPRGLTS